MGMSKMYGPWVPNKLATLLTMGKLDQDLGRALGYFISLPTLLWLTPRKVCILT